MISLFWALAILVVYTYIGYPAIIVFISKFYQRKKNEDTQFRPKVSWVVPSYNEESIIAEKIKNLQALDYPKELLELVIITDGSTDATPTIAASFDGVRVLHDPRRAGKSAAENRAMKHITGDIVVFNDANTFVSKNALLEMVKHYADPKVGGVSGSKGIIVEETDGVESAGEGLYWRYESAIKKADSEVNSLMGAAGELVSFRTSCVQDLPEDTILDDFMQSFYVLKQNMIMVYEPKAKAEERSSASIEEELKRKIRIAAGGWQSMSRLPFMLNIFKRPVQAWMYISHRALRWSISAFALPVLFIVNGLLWTASPLYAAIFVGQVIFYGVAAVAHMRKSEQMPGYMTAIYYFVVMNYCVLAGFKRFLKNSQSASWERSSRKA